MANGMARPAEIKVTGICDGTELRITAPPQPKTVVSGNPANVTVQTYGATIWQWFERNGSSITMLNGQTAATLTVLVTADSTYFVRVGNGTCTLDSCDVLVTVDACPLPDATITAPASLTASATGTASVTTAPGTSASYSWSIPGGTILTGQSTSTITFRAECTGPVTLNVTVTTCKTNSGSAKVTVNPFTATVSGSTTIDQGASATIQAAMTGDGQPWTVTWSDGQVRSASASPHSYSVTPAETATYTVTTVKDRFGCSGAPSGFATITVKPPVPQNVTATASSSAPGVFQVNVSWTHSGVASGFEVYRGTTKVTTTSAAARSYVDIGVQAGNAYLYSVRAVNGGTRSDASARDVATTIAFTDDPLVAGQAAIKAVHLLELRQAVDAVRRAANLPDATFTGTIMAGLAVDATQVEELGTRLNQARSNLGFTLVPLLRHPLAGKLILVSDLNDLRGGVR